MELMNSLNQNIHDPNLIDGNHTCAIKHVFALYVLLLLVMTQCKTSPTPHGSLLKFVHIHA